MGPLHIQQKVWSFLILNIFPKQASLFFNVKAITYAIATLF